MIKFLTAGVAAVIILGIALDVLGTGSEVMASASQVAAKGDRLDSRANENLCGEWPFYHHACAHDLKISNGRTRKVHLAPPINRRHRTFLTFLAN